MKQEDYELKIYCSRVGYNTPFEDAFLKIVLEVMKKYNSNAYAEMCFACTDGEYMTKISKSVCEFGLKTTKMHQPDEYVLTRDLNDLKNIYKDIIIKFATMI